MAYEEHILLVANGFAGLSWGRADILCRALVKNKDRRRIEELGAEFRAQAVRHGRSPEDTEAVWKMLADLAGYMFNKAHSAAYAVEAFRGAYLKTRYPVEFLAAVLSNRRGFYAPIVYVLEALRAGARFLPPDVNLSETRFLVRGDTIRLPLDQVKGLSRETVKHILQARPFSDAGDFYRRLRPHRSEWLPLLKVGALDSLGEPRGRLFWRLARLETVHGNALLEPEVPESGLDGKPKPQWEHELLGFPVSCHPLDYFAPGIDWRRYVPAAELGRHLEKEVEACGLIVCDRLHPTERGTMKFLTLADYTGFLEAALFPDVYRGYGHLTTCPVVALRGRVDPFDNRKGFCLNAFRVQSPRG